ncbi:MAG TPA: nuclear transport factor 2 family protein [Planctomycetota bacterium]|jgi:beta-aspartyl-peptidase (threonine type)|nr:nuclear transport factor 2 family protein [Planctomycetota bacterium]
MGHRALLLVLLALPGCATPDAGRDRQEILDVLQMQAAAWNRGDLDAFLAGYWRSDRTVFAGGDKVHRGFDAMARRYREAYPTREKMGRLSFANLAFEQLETDRAVVSGSWELEIAGSEKRPGGVFTLIWRKFDDGWKIVHDHTSSRP